MKVDGRGVEGFLASPIRVRVILLHGEDEGLIRIRANALTKTVAGTADDPFQVAWLSRDDHDRLLEEATALSMMSGRRVIRVRDAGDGTTGLIKRAAESPGDSLIILETGPLAGRSKLRTFCETDPLAAAIACYSDGPGALQQTISNVMEKAGIDIAQNAKAWLLLNLGSDRGVTLAELEKLVLHAGHDFTLTLSDVQQCTGDQALISTDDAIHAVLAGDLDIADRSLETALESGTSAVAICRMLLLQFSRLQTVSMQVAKGSPVTEAIRQLRPPVFFSRLPSFTTAVRVWPPRRIEAALDAIRRTELACKQTQSPDTLLVRRLVSALARQAAAGGRQG